ncbi:hypothetical protein C8A05DRAFT_35562 [Staphylotrichum tortipilum]|uniref:Uncharacterized protein n=1 Tax=Staphylotrichum tortipilum TaxID=2831512 RepID=A0AAN6MIK8_9PEZI|nr:hypothetical protein C8A05DRAFT_35562 [Staphylotrichum longicolle]
MPAVIPADLALRTAYLNGLHAKIKRQEPSPSLRYKALTFPDALTPAERNSLLWMPPPPEVEANIRRVTGGAVSTPEELFQRVLDDA